jgi:hypothetical protein
MPDLSIQQDLWDDFRLVAKRQKKRPEALAQQVLREYLQRWSDEELIDRSSALARKASFPAASTEEVIRRYRHNKRLQNRKTTTRRSPSGPS